LNPNIEFFDKDRKVKDEEVMISSKQNALEGFTRAYSLVKLISDKTKLETSSYTDKNGYFSVSLPRLVEQDNLRLVIISRAGHSLTKKVLINN